MINFSSLKAKIHKTSLVKTPFWDVCDRQRCREGNGALMLKKQKCTKILKGHFCCFHSIPKQKLSAFLRIKRLSHECTRQCDNYDFLSCLEISLQFGIGQSLKKTTRSSEKTGIKKPCNWFNIMVCSSKWEKTTHYISKLTSGFRPHDSHLYFSLYILCLGTSTFI